MFTIARRSSARLFSVLLVLVLTAFSGLNSKLITARAQSATLIGFASLPAGTLVDGDPSANAYGSGAINGIRVPFDTQPFGSIVGIAPGNYDGTWSLLTSGQFDTQANSSDFQLRIYTVEVDLRTAEGGTGEILISDWLTLQDENGTPLTGADYSPTGLARSEGSYLVADGASGSILQFDRKGRLSGDATAAGLFPNAIGQTVANDAPSGTELSGLSVNDASQGAALFIDSREGQAANVKLLAVIDPVGGSVLQTIDLMNIADPNDLAGLGGTYSMPFAQISAVYPLSDTQFIVINNNRGIFGLGRGTDTAEPTEFAVISIG